MRNIAFISKNSSNKYSGGRLHGWMMAEALAASGYLIHYFTNNKPIFYPNFSEYEGHSRIELFVNKFFIFKKKSKYDFLIIIPHLATKRSFVFDTLFYKAVLKIRKQKSCKVILLDFESPNWVCELIPQVRSLTAYNYSNKFIPKSDIILSTTQIGKEYAMQYYSRFNDKLSYKQIYLGINSLTANKIGFLPKKNQILWFGRFKEKYKGSLNFFNILNAIPSGFNFTIIGNKAELNEGDLAQIADISRRNSFTIIFKHAIDDLEKFTLMSEAKLLIFNSEFEGYGLPPIEAQYMGTKVLCSNLPVLKEVNSSAHFVDFGDLKLLKSSILSLVNSNACPYEIREQVAYFADFEKYKISLKELMTNDL